MKKKFKNKMTSKWRLQKRKKTFELRKKTFELRKKTFELSQNLSLSKRPLFKLSKKWQAQQKFMRITLKSNWKKK